MKTKILITLVLCLAVCFGALGQDPSQKVLQSLMGSKKTANKLPNTYAFDWVFKTKMKTTGKKKSQNSENIINFFLNENTEYYGMDAENKDIKKSGGKAIMIFDFKLQSMIMFANYGAQNMAMVHKLKDPGKAKTKDKDMDYSYKEIGTKTILGYECYGIELENSDGKAILYFTLDAPVNFSAFFAFSSEAAPKGFSDPELFNVLKEEALLMEMEFISKKKNQGMTMTAISLDKKNTSFHKKDYQFMNMGF